MSAQILIVGCGAIGGLFASALAKVADVTAFDANAEHVAAINAGGLRVTGKSPRVGALSLLPTDPAALKRQELRRRHFPDQIEGDRRRARGTCRRRSTGNPILVTLQNGMGNAESFADGTGRRGGARRHHECRASS